VCYDAIINQNSRDIHVLMQADFGIMCSFSLGVQISDWKCEVNQLLIFCSSKRNNKLHSIRKCCLLNISVHMSAL